MSSLRKQEIFWHFSTVPTLSSENYDNVLQLCHTVPQGAYTATPLDTHLPDIRGAANHSRHRGTITIAVFHPRYNVFLRRKEVPPNLCYSISSSRNRHLYLLKYASRLKYFLYISLALGL